MHVHHVLIQKADAAGGHCFTKILSFAGAVDPIKGVFAVLKQIMRAWVLAFVDGSGFARVFLSDLDRSRLRSFVRPVCAVHVTAGPDEVRVQGPNQTNEL